MNKIFKRHLLVLSSIICHLSFSMMLASCSTDAYDKGDGKYSLLRADMVEIFTNGEGMVERVVTDEDYTLRTKPFSIKGMQVPDTLYRAYLYYNVNDDEDDPVSIGRVSTLVPYPFDTLKTDPVNFESAWESTSHRYLNMSLLLKTGTSSGDDYHSIGLHLDTLMTHTDGKRTAHLQFYHDQGGVPEYYSQRIYISIPTDSLAADTVCLRINTYDGVVEKRFP